MKLGEGVTDKKGYRSKLWGKGDIFYLNTLFSSFPTYIRYFRPNHPIFDHVNSFCNSEIFYSFKKIAMFSYFQITTPDDPTFALFISFWKEIFENGRNIETNFMLGC